MSKEQSIADVVAELREKQRERKEKRAYKDWLWKNDYITRTLDARDRESESNE